MLRRQPAEAIIAARKQIVHGAVSMVDQALKELAEKSVDVFRRRSEGGCMVSDLLVVWRGEAEVGSVTNTGTLYH
jgi:hypothetical protein